MNEEDILESLSQEQREAAQKLVEKADAYGVERLNAVYTERNQCVALIARMAIALGYTVGKVVGPSEFCDASEEWNVVFVDLPAGQVSWHIHESEMCYFDFLPLYEGRYDGHDSAEKYRRVLVPLGSAREPSMILHVKLDASNKREIARAVEEELAKLLRRQSILRTS